MFVPTIYAPIGLCASLQKVSEPALVGAGSGSRFGILLYLWSLTMPSGRKGMKDLGREMSKRTSTLVDPQTEELAMKYMGLNIRNRI